MITQIDAKIWEALKSHIATMPGGFDIVEPSGIYPTDTTAAFIVLTDVRFGNVRLYIGSTADDQHGGSLSLAVMAPLDWTHTQLLGVAGIIRNHFVKDTKLAGLVEITKTPDVGIAYRDGAFNRLPVNVTWRAMG